MSDVRGSSYTPRAQFLPFHQRGQRFAAMVCHRGAGKTVACVNDVIAKAIYSTFPLARYAYVAPLRNQAKGLAWDYLKLFTEGLVEKKSEADLYVELRHNKARITLYGADNPDAMRGLHFNGVILDEYGDMNPMTYTKILFPALQARRGWIVFIGTPKGKNHFFDIYKRALAESDWYDFMLKASQSGLLASDILLAARKNMTEDEYEQEYECSFEAAVLGTYYSKIISELEATRHVSELVDYDPEFPVNVNMDIGRTDSAAAWFWQKRPQGIALIDYEEEVGTGPKEWFNILRGKQWEYEKIWLPHDARARTFATERSTIEQFLDTGWPIDIVPKLGVQHGIDAARLVLPMCWFNPRCTPGIEALRAYRREFNEKTKAYSDSPKHDWASNGSDAFRYLSLVAKPVIIPVQEAPPPIRRLSSEPICLEELWAEREERLRIRS
jgi:phage terminase large subunit